MDPLPSHVAMFLQQMGSRLRQSAKEGMAADPNLEPALAIFDEATALRTGLIAPDEQDHDHQGQSLVTRLLPRQMLVRLCGDDLRLSEWLVPSSREVMLVAYRDGTSFHVTELSLAEPEPTEAEADLATDLAPDPDPDTDPDPDPSQPEALHLTASFGPPAPTDPDPNADPNDPFRHLPEQEQAHSLFLKHRDQLVRLAQEALLCDPDRAVAALLLAPEVARNTRISGTSAPAPHEDTGECVYLVPFANLQAMLRTQDQVHRDTLERIRERGRLPILIGTQSGWQLQSAELPG